MSKTYDEILTTEYSEKFDKLRKDMMVVGYYKYGPLSDNFNNEAYDMYASLKKRLAAFEKDKNVEYLADVANYCMMIFMHPEVCGAYYKPTDSNASPGIVGCSIQELKQYE